MRSQAIEKIRKRFKKEWLLIAIDKMDEKRSIPLEGRLVAHSPQQDEIYQVMNRRKGSHDYMVYSTNALPPGYRTAF